MNWFRIILDGIAMSAIFNFGVAAFYIYMPHSFITMFPKKLRDKARPVTREEHKHVIIMCITIYPALILWGVLSSLEANIHGFWNLFWKSYIEMMFMSIGDLVFLDYMLLKKTGTRLHADGVKGDPFYKPKNELLQLGIPEHLVVWPLVFCPLVGFISAGLGLLIRHFI
ncbi:hypothetical protein BCR32DRAFT_282486 [Anaeromyces robustus]|uniref:Uncharacterized protein n=1 Tax=Anaeromyces robustus TaxID=1754192 RepID=A0A1Y1WXD6_9FUNG|nr:hypothetical protein BCR32DRAFT_282486 [Anaeromyces robustus]|eukprot:ORX78211.1 hypothetical protein BCR32DRAFT_282486 [Anaeromyces robustus]